MEPSVTPAIPGSRRPVLAAAAAGRACRMFVVFWAVLGAVGCAFLFYWSTWPYAIPDEPPGPGWISLIASIAALPALAWAAVPVPLLIAGLVHLRRTRPGRWRRPAAWIAAGAAGIGLEALMVAWGAVPYVSPSYAGPAVVAWDSLAEAAGFLVIGAVMMRTPSGPGTVVAVSGGERGR